MKDLGRKSIVFLQLQGTIQIAKSRICKRLFLRRPRTTSPPPSEGRGTNVVEDTGSEIQESKNETSQGNLDRRKNETHKRSIPKLTAKIASPPPSDGRGTQEVEATGSGITGVADGLGTGNLNCRVNGTTTQLNPRLAARLRSSSHSATTASSLRTLITAGEATSGTNNWIKGENFNRLLCGFNRNSRTLARKVTTWNIGRPCAFKTGADANTEFIDAQPTTGTRPLSGE